MPVVAMGWNAERYQGRNLALRLVALGYTEVYWYRGGREAWEVAGLPETELVVAGLVSRYPARRTPNRSEMVPEWLRRRA